MISQNTLRVWLCAGVVLTAEFMHAQVPRTASTPAPQTSTEPQTLPTPAPKRIASQKGVGVGHVQLVRDQDGEAVEVWCSGPVEPAFQVLTNPERLVIEIPGGHLAQGFWVTAARDNMVQAIHVEQQRTPLAVRIVVDLRSPQTYKWKQAGTHLQVRLGGSANPSQSAGGEAGGAESGGGEMVMPVRRMAPGSSITAGSDTAILRMPSGGEVRVCPGTTVSVTPAQNGRDLLLAMSTGAIEEHFHLGVSDDTIVTPDFRILLPGPGEFHFAVSADDKGNTCVRGLQGNTASALVTELMGDRTYQVKPTDQLMFHAGSLDKVDALVPLECGCPPPSRPVVRVAEAPPETKTEAAADNKTEAMPDTKEAAASEASPAAASEPGPVIPSSPPPATAESAKTEGGAAVNSEFVYRAPDVADAPMQDANQMAMTTRERLGELPTPQPEPPPAAKNQSSFWRKVGGFFSRIFR